MEIHAFSGFFSENMKQTRSAGILAALTETYPEMTWDDVLQWAHENGLDEWVPNIDTDDAQPNDVRLVGGDGFINFDDRFPWTAEAQSNFSRWANNYDIGKLPPIQTASPAIQQAFTEPVIASQPAPQQSYPEPVDDWDFFQSQNEDTTLQPVATPATAPAYTQAATPPGGGSAPPGGGNPGGGAALNAMQQVSQKPASGSSNMLLIVGGIIAAYMLMKRKK